MRFFRLMVLVAAFTVIGVGVIHAGEVDGVPVFDDNRVNNWEIDAPVAIYCIFDNSANWNVGVFQSIDVWGLNGEKLLTASAAEIAAAPVGTVLDSNWSYTLTKVGSSAYQVDAPTGYSFSWSRGATGC